MGRSTKPAGPRQARYREIETYLRDLVAAAQPGDPLPTEADLCSQFSVSRMTVRQALGMLGHDGLVERRRGQGTFVGHRLLHRQPGMLMSFTEEMGRRGLAVESRILSAGLAPGRAPELADLRLPPGSDVVRVVRMRCAGGVGVGIEDTALIPSLAPVLEVDLVTGSLHRAIAHRGVHPRRAVGSLSSRLADEDEAQLLDLTPPAAILVELQVLFDGEDAPFERTQTAYSGDRYAVDTIHTRP